MSPLFYYVSLIIALLLLTQMWLAKPRSKTWKAWKDRQDGGRQVDKTKISLWKGVSGEDWPLFHVNKSYSIMQFKTKRNSSHTQADLQTQGFFLSCLFLFHLCLRPTSPRLCQPRSILARLGISPSSAQWN